MKKFGAFSFAAFYLLLTTGVFACILSCGTSHLVEYIATAAPEESHHHVGKSKHEHPKKEKDCTYGKECLCYEKHGQYSVKENLKPSADHQVYDSSETAIIPAFQVLDPGRTVATLATTLPKSNAPSGASVPIFIQKRWL